MQVALQKQHKKSYMITLKAIQCKTKEKIHIKNIQYHVQFENSSIYMITTYRLESFIIKKKYTYHKTLENEVFRVHDVIVNFIFCSFTTF